MGARFVNIDRNTPMLLPVDLREWIEGDDMAHFILEAVELVDLGQFRSNERGSGSPQFPPRMMLALLIYCYSHGIFGSRRIEAATHAHLSVRYLTGNTHPDHDTICKFRRENFAAIAACFLRVLELAKELGLLRLGTVAIDGTRLGANASKHRNVGYARAGELIEQLRLDIAELMQKAEAADTSPPEKEALPQALARREALLEKLQAARTAIEQRAQERAQSQMPAYEAKVQAQAARRHGGRVAQPPSAAPEPDAQINLTDPESRLMRKSRNDAFAQSYNAQAAVCAGGSQLIVGVQVTQNAADKGQLEPTLAAIPAAVGVPGRVLVDNGYLNIEAIGRVMERGVEVYCACAAEAAQVPRRYDFRPPTQRSESPRPVTDPRIQAMQDKLASQEGRAIYRRRQASVEPVFGIIKHALGFRQFRLRGHAKVSGEWQLVALAYNCKRLCRLRQTGSGGDGGSPAAAAARPSAHLRRRKPRSRSIQGRRGPRRPSPRASCLGTWADCDRQSDRLLTLGTRPPYTPSARSRLR
jgi:transposase